jgi:putative ABC transport system permease protein
MSSQWTLWREMVLVALRSIKGQALRTTLTVAIIAIGIMALIAMVTATESLQASVREEFSSLGTQNFTVDQNRSGGMFNGRRALASGPITYREAMRFQRERPADFEVTVSVFGSSTVTAGRNSRRTNPNVSLQGVDDQFLEVSGLSLADGRNMTLGEVELGTPVAIVGQSVVDKLFESWESPVGQQILVGTQKYTIAGVLASRGTSFGMSQDNQLLVPIPCVRRQFSDQGRSYCMTCTVNEAEGLDRAVDLATGLMRQIRQDAPGKPNSFRIRQSNRLVETLMEATQGITIAAAFIGLITLLGAGIGLMNIMLVSVSERTREIGTRKSLGASSQAIRTQFLVEVMVIGQLGGVVGIVLGLLVGNLIAGYFDTAFLIPWVWVTTGVLLCLGTSLASGYYPARMAANLDPIVALGRE